jgi:hypothetical protein
MESWLIFMEGDTRSAMWYFFQQRLRAGVLRPSGNEVGAPHPRLAADEHVSPPPSWREWG